MRSWFRNKRKKIFSLGMLLQRSSVKNKSVIGWKKFSTESVLLRSKKEGTYYDRQNLKQICKNSQLYRQFELIPTGNESIYRSLTNRKKLVMLFLPRNFQELIHWLSTFFLLKALSCVILGQIFGFVLFDWLSLVSEPSEWSLRRVALVFSLFVIHWMLWFRHNP